MLRFVMGFLFMRPTIVAYILVFSFHCHAQDDHALKLSARLATIRELETYNNTVVIYHDTLTHGMAFPYWTAAVYFYEGEMARFKHSTYAALDDSRGERPDISTQYWSLVEGPHPYLF